MAESSEQPALTVVISRKEESHSLPADHTISTLEIEEQSNDAARRRGKLRTTAVLIALYLAVFIAALDQTIIATAIPTITSTLHSSSGYVWIGGAYLLANAACGPIWAKVSDIWGRKSVLLTAVAVFFAASIICANAVNIRMLIAGRALQGAAGGGLFQLVLITISDLFSVRERSLYMGLIEVMWAIAGASGPILGGTFSEKLNWRWCFWVNLPISGTTFILLLLFLDVHNPRTSVRDGLRAVDWIGSVSLLGFALLFLLGLQFGGVTFAWNSPQVICLIAIGALISVVFVFSEKKFAQHPIMPLSIFKQRSNIACLVLCFFHGMVFLGDEYYLPLHFQSVKGSSPLHSGILVIPLIITEALTGIFVGIFIHRTGHFLELIYAGSVLMTIGSGLYIKFGVTSSLGMILGFQIATGLGLGLLFEAPLIAVQATVKQDDVATATSTVGFVRNLATSLSVVIGGVIFQNSMDRRVPSLAKPPVNLPHDIIELFTGGAAAANVEVVNSIQNTAQKLAIREAYAWSMRNLWIFYTCLAGLTIIASTFIERQHLSKIHVETKTGIKEKEQQVS
ncbi:putative MFS transporter [Xylogone sp. PMI_703]|nr:putative MFS transporter [Xylogone sp. PMI_703]